MLPCDDGQRVKECCIGVQCSYKYYNLKKLYEEITENVLDYIVGIVDQ